MNDAYVMPYTCSFHFKSVFNLSLYFISAVHVGYSLNVCVNSINYRKACSDGAPNTMSSHVTRCCWYTVLLQTIFVCLSCFWIPLFMIIHFNSKVMRLNCSQRKTNKTKLYIRECHIYKYFVRLYVRVHGEDIYLTLSTNMTYRIRIFTGIVLTWATQRVRRACEAAFD